MTEGHQRMRITIALCAGILARAALEFTHYYPEMRQMLERDLRAKMQLLIDALDGKDVISAVGVRQP